MSSDDHYQTNPEPPSSSGGQEAARGQARRALSSRLVARGDASGCRKYSGTRRYWGLTLRAAAREAGVSHAAPKNHFGDVMGLLSDLAAVGFARFRAVMEGHIRKSDPAPARLEAIGRGYVTFARTHRDLFLLMFRSERLDFTRPVLRSAADAALDVLAATVRAVRDEPMQATLTLPQAAQMVVAWSLVHGFAMLLLDDRLKQLIAKLPPGVDEMAFLPAILTAALPKT